MLIHPQCAETGLGIQALLWTLALQTQVSAASCFRVEQGRGINQEIKVLQVYHLSLHFPVP